MKNYLAISFFTENIIERQILNFLLDENGVSSIEEAENRIVAYYETQKWNLNKPSILSFCEVKNIPFDVVKIENKNWNAEWESSFKPVMIENFCYVRAPFHKQSQETSLIDIILEPKMAFGTAHHETTYMMMASMKNIDFTGKKVFDYGCGTGILSVLAEKLGATAVFAIDIEDIATENAIYNLEINGCNKVAVETNILENIGESKFDIILANINRKVLLNSTTRLKEIFKSEGILLVSGVLVEDLELVKNAYILMGFNFLEERKKGEWSCIKFQV